MSCYHTLVSEVDGPYRYRCTKCSKQLKLASGMLLGSSRPRCFKCRLFIATHLSKLTLLVEGARVHFHKSCADETLRQWVLSEGRNIKSARENT